MLPSLNFSEERHPAAKSDSSYRGLDLHDLRFRALLGNSAWSALPKAIRDRFGRRLTAAAVITYAGEVAECRMSTIGWLLAQLARAIGGPLPIGRDIAVPAVVTVSEDPSSGGQFWTRIYGRARGFPQVIHSSKRFAGPTGLEEYLGGGFGIALTVSADDHALHFHSDHYFMSIGRVRLRVPQLFAPGALTISHVNREDGWFAFVLSLRHPIFGEMIRQAAVFHEHVAGQDEEPNHE